MISAMYENGGNTTQRFLDGHPELFSYPFESQLGTRYVTDYLSSVFPVKYRWPVFPLHAEAAEDYETIIDEECKVRLKTPHSSKFRGYPLRMSDARRKEIFLGLTHGRERTRALLVEAFFRASAEAWEDARRSRAERVYVGYSPIVVVDADKILADFPEAHVLHVVRNPWSAYADTKKRAVPLSLAHYITGWCLNQQSALTCVAQAPDRAHILRFEDLIADPVAELTRLLARLGVGRADSLGQPSWNGQPLTEVYPWGTIRVPTAAVNRQTAEELSLEERQAIELRTRWLLPALGYDRFWTT
jgi:hypothetical protein